MYFDPDTGRGDYAACGSICSPAVSEKTIQRAVAAGELEIDDIVGRMNVIRFQDVVEWQRKRERELVQAEFDKSRPAYDDDGLEIDEHVERKKKLKAERIGQEIKNAEALGELAPIDLMISALGDCIENANTFLESVPARIKRVWPEIDGAVLERVNRKSW